MPRYAQNTEVSADRSLMDIKRTLERYGARGFGFAECVDSGTTGIAFRVLDSDGTTLAVRITLPLPDRDSDEFTRTRTGKDRSEDVALKSWEQACRSSWRSLALVIKAKLEAVEAGISTIEREFLPDVLLPSGQTIGSLVHEQKEALASGAGLRLLTAGGE